MKRILIAVLAGTLMLGGCGIDGEPLTPPAKTSG
jgi:hypothetical protein